MKKVNKKSIIINPLIKENKDIEAFQDMNNETNMNEIDKFMQKTEKNKKIKNGIFLIFLTILSCWCYIYRLIFEEDDIPLFSVGPVLLAADRGFQLREQALTDVIHQWLFRFIIAIEGGTGYARVLCNLCDGYFLKILFTHELDHGNPQALSGDLVRFLVRQTQDLSFFQLCFHTAPRFGVTK